MEINAQDIDLLREFRKLTPYYSSVTERTRSTNFAQTSHTAVWTVCSLEARTRLNELGLPYGHKSTAISPPCVEFSRRDYLRGLIDADGSVGYTSRGLPFVSLTTASTAAGAYLCDYAKEVTGVQRAVTRNTRDGIYNILYTMEAGQRLAADLYYPGSLSLARKQVAADSLAVWGRPPGMRVAHTRRRWNETEDRILLKINSPTAAAERLGRTVQSCSLRLWRLRSGQAPTPSDQ
ncbi:LAGLIDADG family homing endonuclease [Streptomyces anandii]|uniref:LAGLIDADG family homing endonuclease n=1 Tax=Streptomyces anandii TaxID=285454 RepID=A0ABW6H3C9_9ACTN